MNLNEFLTKGQRVLVLSNHAKSVDLIYENVFVDIYADLHLCAEKFREKRKNYWLVPCLVVTVKGTPPATIFHTGACLVAQKHLAVW